MNTDVKLLIVEDDMIIAAGIALQLSYENRAGTRATLRFNRQS